MQRRSLAVALMLAALAAMGVFASVSMAERTETPFTAEYNATEYYGPVKCEGVRIVSTHYPNGKDRETCISTAVPPLLTNMVAGKGQTCFKNGVTGNCDGGWYSDFDGKLSTNFKYTAGPRLTKFKIIAIY